MPEGTADCCCDWAFGPLAGSEKLLLKRLLLRFPFGIERAAVVQAQVAAFAAELPSVDNEVPSADQQSHSQDSESRNIWLVGAARMVTFSTSSVTTAL